MLRTHPVILIQDYLRVSAGRSAFDQYFERTPTVIGANQNHGNNLNAASQQHNQRPGTNPPNHLGLDVGHASAGPFSPFNSSGRQTANDQFGRHQISPIAENRSYNPPPGIPPLNPYPATNPSIPPFPNQQFRGGPTGDPPLPFQPTGPSNLPTSATYPGNTTSVRPDQFPRRSSTNSNPTVYPGSNTGNSTNLAGGFVPNAPQNIPFNEPSYAFDPHQMGPRKPQTSVPTPRGTTKQAEGYGLPPSDYDQSSSKISGGYQNSSSAANYSSE